MQPSNRPPRPARASRPNPRQQPAPASDHNPHPVSDARQPSDKPDHHAHRPAPARHNPSTAAPPRSRRTQSRHRKSKNRTESNAAAATLAAPPDVTHPAHSATVASSSAITNDPQPSPPPSIPVAPRNETHPPSIHTELNPAHRVSSDHFASATSAPSPQLPQQHQLPQNQRHPIQHDPRPASTNTPPHQRQALFQPLHTQHPAQPSSQVTQPSAAQTHREHPEQRHAVGQPTYISPPRAHRDHSRPTNVQPLERQLPQHDQVQPAPLPSPRPSQHPSYADVTAQPVMHPEAVSPHHPTSASQSAQLGKQALAERSASPCESQQSFAFAGRPAPFTQLPYQLVSPDTQPSGQRVASPARNDLVPDSASNVNPNPAPVAESTSVGHSGTTRDSSGASEGKPRSDCDRKSEDDVDRIIEFVSHIKASPDGPRARPLICQDITNSNADTLRISRLPRGMTYDRLYSMVEPFGDVEDIVWSSSDPYVCEVTYRDPSAAHEAKHFLGDAMVGSNAAPPLKVELHSRDPGAQLFVGDLTPDVTEEMLETTFSKLVGEPVTALLKRDPDTFSPIGYGFLSFKSESSANFALVAGHRAKIGNACVRVGRAERNTYLYISDLNPNVTMSELKAVFGKFGSLVEEDTVIVKRTYAFVRYKNRTAAEKAKRTLDKTDLRGRLSVRYAEAEPLKACVAVQFHSSVPRPPNSLRDLLIATFSKHGNCSVEIPRLTNGLWRKVAFVTFHGEPMAANLAALEAVQTVRFVSSLPVCCQFARELIPRLPAKGLVVERGDEQSGETSNYDVPAERLTAKLFPTKRNVVRRSDSMAGGSKGSSRSGPAIPDRRAADFRNDGLGRSPNYVPVYVPVTALQHPNTPLPPGSVIGNDGTSNPYNWPGRVLLPGNAQEGVGPHANHLGSNYNAFGPDRYSRW